MDTAADEDVVIALTVVLFWRQVMLAVENSTPAVEEKARLPRTIPTRWFMSKYHTSPTGFFSSFRMFQDVRELLFGARALRYTCRSSTKLYLFA